MCCKYSYDSVIMYSNQQAKLFVDRLLNRKANTSVTDSELNTSLCYAARKGCSYLHCQKPNETSKSTICHLTYKKGLIATIGTCHSQ